MGAPNSDLPSLSALAGLSRDRLEAMRTDCLDAIEAVLKLGQSNNFLGRAHNRASLPELEALLERINFALRDAAGQIVRETRASFRNQAYP